MTVTMEDGSTASGIVRGVDVYGLAAVTLVHGAELMSAPGYDRAGALGPAAAFDPDAFLKHLAAHRVSWELAPRGKLPLPQARRKIAAVIAWTISRGRACAG